AMASHPAAISGAPEDVLVAIIEDPLERFLDEQVVAGGGVLDSLGFAGGAARVEDEQRRFAVERLGGAIGRCLGNKIMPPMVAPGLHLDGCARATQHDAVLNGGG